MTISVHDLRKVDPGQAAAWMLSIADNMRPADVEEIRVTGSQLPIEALLRGYYEGTHGWVICDRNGEPIAMFGAAPSHIPGAAAVWMLGTPGILREAVSIARQTRPYLDELSEAYPYLWNYIDARNAVSMRWLQWGGFQLLKEHRFGPEGHLFYSFARSRPCVDQSPSPSPQA